MKNETSNSRLDEKHTIDKIGKKYWYELVVQLKAKAKKDKATIIIFDSFIINLFFLCVRFSKHVYQILIVDVLNMTPHKSRKNWIN